MRQLYGFAANKSALKLAKTLLLVFLTSNFPQLSSILNIGNLFVVKSLYFL